MDAFFVRGVRVHEDVTRCHQRVKCLELGDWLEARGSFDPRLGGGFKKKMFTQNLGEASHFDEHTFSKGWLNHQLDEFLDGFFGGQKWGDFGPNG